ncbi:hypothetical protein J4E86_004178 [Alternaria arbusti]|uniref:uncharacterized protein n=1 Tax=Alternaria arbusti TaxID=232088 RepID=UPI00221E89C2|nr:uncharacterized protein J4E86_004178 [Alternaria arbusti]KAI4958574.1 hypothetical protein J4E86_004178 [Alternaria arbusti]
MRLSAGLLCIVTQAWTVNANVEKTIFLGPSPVTLSNVRPGLDDLGLHYLSPSSTILPIRVPVQFPTESLPRGLESWYLLRGLQDGRRYEVRICWPATQPTDFWLDTYSVTHVFDTPEFISSLSEYNSVIRRDPVDDDGNTKEAPPAAPESVLFLRLQAAASYYSTNRTLMDYPPPVDADIILDPFILNVFPQSLGPIAIYITAVALGAWFLSGHIYRWLLSVAAESPSKPHTD